MSTKNISTKKEKKLNKDSIIYQASNERESTTFPTLTAKASFYNMKEVAAQNSCSDIIDDKVSNQISRFRILPPIEQRDTSTPCTKINKEESMRSIGEFLLENKNSCPEKAIALPPIESSDGIPLKFNTLIKQNYDRIQQEKEHKANPKKRMKAHIVHKDPHHSDSFELLKAEKIRCIELEKYQDRMNINNAVAKDKISNKNNISKNRNVKRNRNKRNKRVVEGGGHSTDTSSETGYNY